MRQLEPSDLWSLPDYERVREDFRRRIIELKKRRRVQVGPLLSFIFENRDTVLFQVQGMLRGENVAEPERVQEELDIYNALLPKEGELSATLFIEVTDQARLLEELRRLEGIDRAVFLDMGEGQRIPAVFEEGRAKGEVLSTIQYVRFRLSPGQAGGQAISLVVDHPNYAARTLLSEETRQALAKDLAG